MSYANVILYSQVIPSYNSKKDDKKAKQQSKNITPQEFFSILKNHKTNASNSVG